MGIMTGGNIQVDSKLKIKYITALKLMIEAQKHGFCIVEGVLENGAEAQDILDSERDISAGIRNIENGEILFKGIIKEAKISCENGLWSIRLHLVTVSERLDRDLNQRSFQNKAMTYEEAVRRVLKPYENLAAVYVEGEEEVLQKPVIQYGETDWEFLLRLGSRLHIPLYAEHLTGCTGFYFGMRKGRDINIDTSVCHMGISQSCYTTDGRESGLTRRDYRYYVIVSDENYQIGDMLRFGIGSGRIFRKCAKLIHECLEYTYWAGGCGNWYIPKTEHRKLAGMEFTGSVVDTCSEKVKISLMIDEPYKEAEHEWNWMPVSGNIMYAMPEKGSLVRLSFGSEEAAEGIVMSNPRDNGADMPGQQERTFMTQAGKRMDLYPENLSFQAGSGGTSIIDGKGVSIGSMNRIEMTASGIVSLYASKIHAQTPLEINMYKTESYCSEKGNEIRAKGTKSNPPTGSEDSGFTMSSEFNALSRTGILCGSDFIRYRPFPDAPNEFIIEEFSMEKLLDNVKEGAIVVFAVTGAVVYVVSIVASGGATLTLAPWIIGGCTFLTGGLFVGSQAVEDYRNQEVNSGAVYVARALEGTGKGAEAGISYCMAPYAAHMIVSGVLPPGMVEITIGNSFISGEVLVASVTKVGQVLTASNIIVLENDAAEGMLGRNVLQGALGETGYKAVKDVSKAASDEILTLGLFDMAGYGINRGGVVDEGGSKTEKITTVEGGTKTIHNISELSNEQIEALIKYTGDDYANINNSLRGVETLTLENQTTVEVLKSALDNSALPHDMTLYRGTSTEALGALQDLSVDELVGKTFTEQGFMSTSTSNVVAEGFSGNMQMTIEASKGAQALDISSISQYTTEAEVLFNTGQEMLITSAEVKNGILHITVIIE